MTLNTGNVQQLNEVMTWTFCAHSLASSSQSHRSVDSCTLACAAESAEHWLVPQRHSCIQLVLLVQNSVLTCPTAVAWWHMRLNAGNIKKFLTTDHKGKPRYQRGLLC